MSKFINIADLTDPNDDQGRTYREINNTIEHKFKQGDIVIMRDSGAVYTVSKQTRDCDGTPLYTLATEIGVYHGINGDDLVSVSGIED